jgi:glycosyltransferase involved in cell wall biosynthesis
MRQADIFIITSAWEGFGNVIVEALYCGLRIVATDCPSGPSEILKRGKYGILCQVGDVPAIATAIDKVGSRGFSADAQKRRALDFHVDVIGEQYAKCFETLVAGK